MVSLQSMIQSIIVPKKYFSEGVTQKIFAGTEVVRIEEKRVERGWKVGNYCKRKELLARIEIKHLFC